METIVILFMGLVACTSISVTAYIKGKRSGRNEQIKKNKEELQDLTRILKKKFNL